MRKKEPEYNEKREEKEQNHLAKKMEITNIKKVKLSL
jgi:hypothetical protein